MIIQTDKIQMRSEIRTISPIGADYNQIGRYFLLEDTLSDSNSLALRSSAYSKLGILLALSVIILLAFSFIPAYSENALISQDAHSDYTQFDFNRLADAIRLAENSRNHPYGIIYPGCDKHSADYCRHICLNTLRKAYKRFCSINARKQYSPVKATNSLKSSLNANNHYHSFVAYLSKTYAPIGSKNDPNNLNIYWIKNVEGFLNA